MSTQPLGRSPGEGRAVTASLGTIVVGAILVALGLLWFIDTLDVVTLNYGALLAVGLVVVGVGLVAGARSGVHGGLVVLGLMLTLALTVATAVSVPLHGTVGDQNISLRAIEDVQSKYNVTAGNLTLDFQRVAFPAGDTNVEVRVGAGNLSIDVPRDVAVQVRYQVGVGDVTVFGHNESGIGMDSQRETAGFASADHRLILDVNVGAGELEVRQ
ncbi:MAG TPA: cell wall-active antibiotics response protein LiaF [Nitrolancea sp.]|nr:cell wall-active antibiotics response protein LiaF [Nitrolancea sp.]